MIRFSKPNGLNGWLSLHSPHGFKYQNENWNSAAQAWYSIVHNVGPIAFAKGHYKTVETELTDSEKFNQLLGILKAKIDTHPILVDYLLETEDSTLFYSISRFASQDQKYLGINEEEQLGRNKLGIAWTQIRDQLQKQRQCQKKAS